MKILSIEEAQQRLNTDPQTCTACGKTFKWKDSTDICCMSGPGNDLCKLLMGCGTCIYDLEGTYCGACIRTAVEQGETRS